MADESTSIDGGQGEVAGSGAVGTGARPSLARELGQGRTRAVLTFAGQGLSCIDHLAQMVRERRDARRWVEAAAAAILELVEGEREFVWSGLYGYGYDLMRWLDEPTSRPSEEVLTSSVISQPLIFITQIMRYQALYEEGLGAAFEAGTIASLTGHSQGMMPALLVAESPGGRIDPERFLEYVRYFTWQGLHMARSFEGFEGEGAPMASVAGPGRERLEALVSAFNARLPEDQRVYITLYNTRTRHVLSGPAASLEALRAQMAKVEARERQARREGRHGGSALRFVWEPLAVGAAFHSPYMTRGMEGMLETVARIGFEVPASALKLEVISPATAARLNDSEDLTRELVVSQFVRPVRWLEAARVAASRAGVEYLLDLGPGDGVARLTRSALRGTAARVLALSEASERATFFTEGAARPARPVVYEDFAPRLVTLPSGQVAVDNRYTRTTGRGPVILAGMTPTTVDAGIVAAAANAGYTAELAGGGQVTAEVFDSRVEELRGLLEPGREVTFNALLLDPYLWNLHLGRGRLVQRARRAGAPICGVTVSAGIPEVDEAVALLDDLRAEGLWLNAFKPGTVDQVERVVKIARAASSHTIFVHLEGGRAGGHHSWEDLDQLLLESYALIRSQPNLVLCVGGGVATEARAVALLTGRWAEAHGELPMPVDAVFLGTLAMACLEATASPQVKRALVEAAGTDRWVYNGQHDGGVTSGRSQLNADIHYLDNAAARCGRLLDEVAGDAQAVSARRAEIIEALGATSRPFFGELEEMTYLEVASRMVELMAIGYGGAYEDGVWPDRSWRQRVFDFLRRAQARLASQDEGPVPGLLSSLSDLDEPAEALSRFAASYPQAAARRLHLADVRHFVHAICARPGKPVNFVPVIDADVRRWYKADTLWQAQDPRFEAEQVLVLPGPEAVAGIRQADEPVASLLGRFEGALVEALSTGGVTPPQAERLRAPLASGDWPTGIECDSRTFMTTLRAVAPADPHAWLESVAARFSGQTAALLGVPRIFVGDRSVRNPLLDLCRAEVGSTLNLRVGVDGAAEEITCQPARARGERVRLLRHGADAVRLEVTTPGLGGGAGARWELTLRYALKTGDDVFTVEAEAYDEALRAFYGQALFGQALSPTPLFELGRGEVVVDEARAKAYAALTGAARGVGAPLDMAFSLCWEPLFSLLACEELSGGLLDLVHQIHHVERGAAWPPVEGETLQVEARVVRVEDAERGREIEAQARVLRGAEVVATLEEVFFIRGTFGHTPWVTRRLKPLEAEIVVEDAPALTFLQEHGWIRWSSPVSVGDALVVRATLAEARPRRGVASFEARGQVLRDGVVIGEVALEVEREALRHPLEALIEVLRPVEASAREVARRTLARAEVRAPGSMDAFAEVSRDLNPIHRSVLMARMAGLGQPIVHGMWSAARLRAFLVSSVAGGRSERVRGFRATFLAPASLGAVMSLEAVRVGSRDGRLKVEAVASVQGQPVVRAEAWIEPAPVACVFPGQGIQRQGMGMEGYGRSRAARAVWERADAFTRLELGFSILHVVRANPTELLVDGRAWIHPAGVLHLTQFTQVAMAVLAQAQVAELEEAGLLPEGAITCGHSVGEYNALSAVTRVLPLEDVVDIVYHRGLVMHTLVPRDAEGESGYRMGVIRPHYAGLSDAQAEALVKEIRNESGAFIQIVNYNIRGRQYSVTGRVEALSALERALAARTPEGGKPAYVEVPGIDVPFHSEVLRGGVDNFRRTLQARLPQVIDPARLLGRYIPNLVPRPFSLERAFVQEVVSVTDTPVLVEVLADWEAWASKPVALTRVLLIELLAWQFTSPVRWIETQELLLAPSSPVRVSRVLEVGVGYQPTLANMARYTTQLLKTSGVEILNVEADAEVVFMTDTDPEPEVVVEAPTASEAAPEAAAPVVAVVAAPVASASAAPVEDVPVSVAEGLRFILAVQARVRPDQIRADETIDELFEGVSSRRNQVLLDLGAEFNLGTIDGAHEKPIADLVAEIERRAGSWRCPGRYLKPTQDEALGRLFGRAGVGRKDIEAYVAEHYGLGAGLAAGLLNVLTLESRAGDSGRGGALGRLAEARPGTKAEAMAVLDQAVALLAEQRGVAMPRRGQAGGGGGAVDSAALRELDERLTGRDGVLMRMAGELVRGLGHGPEVGDDGAQVALAQAEARLAQLTAEHGEGYEAMIAPAFDARRAVAFTSGWAWAQRDVARLYFELASGTAALVGVAGDLSRLARWAVAEPRVARTAAWYAGQAREAGRVDLAEAFEALSLGRGPVEAPMSPTRPSVSVDEQGGLRYAEVPREGVDAQGFVEGLWPAQGPSLASVGVDGALDGAWREAMLALLEAGVDFGGQTALVTGASPGSIALEIVALLLRGGARVVVTTSSASRDRIAFYRRFHQQHGAPGAELHVVPFNQASNQDIDALVSWLFEAQTEQAGASVRVLKRPWAPSLLVPFAALKEAGTLDLAGASAQAAIRAMLLGVERLVTAMATRFVRVGVPRVPCHVLLPLSPNHGGFGGDGVYAETKIGLEVLANKWRSEREAWGRAVTLCDARIGWVRGTGLMDANNPVAAKLEEEAGVRTFSSQEMGLMLTALCAPRLREAALEAPVKAELTGGFERLGDVRAVVDGLRAGLEVEAGAARRLHGLRQREAALLGDGLQPAATVEALPSWPRGAVEAQPLLDGAAPRRLPGQVPLDQVVVIVGLGEVGPWGSARTRFEVEAEGALSAAGVLELAWVTGLVRFEGDGGQGQWIDVESGEAVEESQIAARYREAVMARSGIRFIEPDTAGFDPDAVPIWTTAFLERDFTFQVTSEQEARAFVAADPAHTRAAFDAEAEVWRVTRAAGTQVRVPRQLKLSRRVAGQVPDGFDFTRFGLAPDMVENVDRVTLFNLVATVEAFLSAGLSPEELLSRLHPARVANTQGSGIGGMRSLRRLYTDYLLGESRQRDVLQETLINVVAAYVVQSYVGSYGPMSHPVAACATAAVSLEEGADKILAGKADFAVTGGFDDIEREGAVGFSDMSATAETDTVLAMGLAPDQISRANDARRRGFVEAQGGGTILLARGSVAKELGLPVLGVVAWAGSFGDGIHKSIPAPGLGALAAATGGARSPLGQALGRFGLTADDIALVYKHDTSTAANDPNENALHDRIQTTLGRTEGNPLWVVSQKTLTGHPKGGAAAWQIAGLCQSMARGVIPGNRNLDCVDGAMAAYGHMGFTDVTLRPGQAAPLRAGLVTSLGFGHVSAIALILHPQSFIELLDDQDRQDWLQAVEGRLESQARQHARILMGQEVAFEKRTHRRFEAPDGSDEQVAEESAALLDPAARLDLGTGLLVTRGPEGVQ